MTASSGSTVFLDSAQTRIRVRAVAIRHPKAIPPDPSDDDGFRILDCHHPSGPEHGRIPVLGDFGRFFALNEVYDMLGDVEVHDRFGQQFKALSWRIATPADPASIARYLAKHISGVGQRTADLLTGQYGRETLDVIRQWPDLVAIETGVPESRLLDASRDLREKWEAAVAETDLESLIGPRVGRKVFNAILRHHGPTAAVATRENPYGLAGIKGVGFPSADTIALVLGHDPKSLRRVQAAAEHFVYGVCRDTGSTVVRADSVLFETRELTGQNELAGTITGPDGVPPDLVYDAPTQTFEWRQTVNRELAIAERLRDISRDDGSWIAGRIDAEIDTLRRDARESGHDATDQIDAVRKVWGRKLALLTGRPGTGKSWITAWLIRLMRSRGTRVVVAAPTGKAAKRISEWLQGATPARTIHSLLGMTPDRDPSRIEENPISADVVVVDESSMLTVDLLYWLMRGIGNRTSVLFVGDPEQLPPTGLGDPFCDVIAAAESAGVATAIPHARLRTIKRNSGALVRAIHAVGDGMMPEWSPKLDLSAEAGDRANVRFVETAPDETSTKVWSVLRSLKKQFGIDPVWEAQVLSPLVDKGDCSCKMLNMLLAPLLLDGQIAMEEWEGRPGDDDSDRIAFRVGEKVIRLRNGNVDSADGSGKVPVVNGDIGMVTTVRAAAYHVQHWFPDREVSYRRRQHLCAMAWALTVHKMQGSSAPVVVMPVHSMFIGKVWTRRLVYTALSRAERGCVLLGQEDVFARALPTTRERETRLTERIKEAFHA